MRRSFSLPAGFAARLRRDPRTIARAVLGVLLLANLIAAYAVFRPVGGSAEELDSQIAALQTSAAATPDGAAAHAAAGEPHSAGSRIRATSFWARTSWTAGPPRRPFSGNWTAAAKESALRPKERSFTYDPIEGTDKFSMMTVVANYEGTYGDLLQFVNRLDKSQRFLIIDTLAGRAAAGRAGNAERADQVQYVREGRELARMKLGAERKKVVILAGLLVVALLVYLFNGGSGSSRHPGAAAVTPRPNPAASPGALPAGSAGPPATAAAGSSARRGRTSAEFRPILGHPRGQPRPDPDDHRPDAYGLT